MAGCAHRLAIRADDVDVERELGRIGRLPVGAPLVRQRLERVLRAGRAHLHALHRRHAARLLHCRPKVLSGLPPIGVYLASKFRYIGRIHLYAQ